MNDLDAFRERAKELRCLYRVNAAVSNRADPPAAVFLHVLAAIPDGWRRSESTGARIEYLGRHYVGPGYASMGRAIQAPLQLFKTPVGFIEVTDASALEPADGVFLPEEQELLQAIAKRVGEYLEWKHTQLLGERLPAAGEHWRWREQYVQALVTALDRARFGVTRVYLGGSTASGDAGPGSDVDLFFECDGTPAQRRELDLWLEGWSHCLAAIAVQQTGYPVVGGLLDVHYLEPAAALRMRTELRELFPAPDRIP